MNPIILALEKCPQKKKGGKQRERRRKEKSGVSEGA
jgi:hypothetical protein